MHRAWSSRLLVLALLAAVALAVVRVASVPAAPGAPDPAYTWQGALTQVVTDVRATVQGVRAHALAQRATYAKMWRDTQQLEQRLNSPSQ